MQLLFSLLRRGKADRWVERKNCCYLAAYLTIPRTATFPDPIFNGFDRLFEGAVLQCSLVDSKCERFVCVAQNSEQWF